MNTVIKVGHVASIMGIWIAVLVLTCTSFISCSDDKGGNEPEPEPEFEFYSQEELKEKMLEADCGYLIDFRDGRSHESVEYLSDIKGYYSHINGASYILQSWFSDDEIPVYGWYNGLNHAISAPGGKVKVKLLTSLPFSFAEIHCRINGEELNSKSMDGAPGVKVTELSYKEFEITFAENNTADARTYVICLQGEHFSGPYLDLDLNWVYTKGKAHLNFVQVPYGRDFKDEWLYPDNFYIPYDDKDCIKSITYSKEEVEEMYGE